MLIHCCHCLNCQRQTGSAFVINLLIEADHVELLAGVPQPIDVPRDLSGLSIKTPRVRIVHTTDPHFAGGSMYLQEVDPWLGHVLFR